MVADAEVTEYVSEEKFSRMLQHHLVHRQSLESGINVTLYDVGKENDLCVFASNDEATLVTVAFKDGMIPLLERLLSDQFTLH